MGEAEQFLRQQKREEALGQQGQALNQLRAGAQEMARQIQQQGQSGQDNTGRDGEARGETHDPLGRPMPDGSDNFGPKENMLPSELAIRRAREILEILRSRANTPDLPRIDKDYIDRLLRGLIKLLLRPPAGGGAARGGGVPLKSPHPSSPPGLRRMNALFY